MVGKDRTGMRRNTNWGQAYLTKPGLRMTEQEGKVKTRDEGLELQGIEK
jgi:hypothetical protein